MELIPIKDTELETWDELISRFDTKSLFHQSVWLKFIETTQSAEKLLLGIEQNNVTIGYFAGLVLQKGPFRILGSPLVGWTTEYMGPIVNKDFNQVEFIVALEEYCKSLGIDHLELSNPILNHAIMESRGFQYKASFTPIVSLSANVEQMWKRLPNKSCRYMIRKALSNGLIVEDTDNPEVVNEYYSQLVEVFTNKGLMPTYPRSRVKALFEQLKWQDMLFALQAKYKDRIIAVGLFPHYGNCVYYWGGASYSEFRHLCPNELIQWTLMKLAIERGISKYDMCGGNSLFKMKFGGELESIYHWYKSFNPFAKIARSAYQRGFKLSQRISGTLKKFHQICS